MMSNLTVMQICNKADQLLCQYDSYSVMNISDTEAHLLALLSNSRGSSSGSPPDINVPEVTMRSCDETHLWLEPFQRTFRLGGPLLGNRRTGCGIRQALAPARRDRLTGEHACGQRGNGMLCVVSAAMLWNAECTRMLAVGKQ
jgi:hypothetical protein